MTKKYNCTKKLLSRARKDKNYADKQCKRFEKEIKLMDKDFNIRTEKWQERLNDLETENRVYASAINRL